MFSAFLNAQTCKMFQKRVETITASNPAFDPPGDRNVIITTTQRAFRALQVEYSSTTTIPLGVPSACTDPVVSGGTITDNSYEYSYNCFGTTYTVRYDYSEPISEDYIETLHLQLESYISANWNYLNTSNLPHVVWSWNASANQLQVNPTTVTRNQINHIKCGPLGGSETDDKSYGMFAGFMKTAASGQFGELSRLIKLQAEDPFVSQFTPRYLSWFTRAQMTREYLVKRQSVGPINNAVQCQRLGPFIALQAPSIWYYEANCTQTQLQQFSDGYDQNNQPRTMLFGPLDRTPHLIKIACLN